MPKITDDVKKTAMEGVNTAKELASEIVNKELEVVERLAQILDDKEVEFRLKFENLTINGNIALSGSFLKKR